MGLSTKKSKSTSQASSTATVAPSDAYKPNIDAAVSTFKPAYDAANANNANLLGRVNGAMDTSSAYFNDVLAGKYLDGNPHLQSVLDAANRDVTSGVNSNFESAGRYGSGYHADILARALSDNEEKLRYGDYATERGYQQAAGAALPAVTGSLAGLSSGLPTASAKDYSALLDLVRQYTTGTSNSTGSGTNTQSGASLADWIAAAASLGSAAMGKP